ncbi:hypothetical protein CGRA01v4_11611 [Colletotrichum graminicola]|nr:hypothetical protein CGRA01v4_11611 [Colletotrichum graminicola]
MALNWASKSLSSLANSPRPSLFCAQSSITHHQVICCRLGQSILGCSMQLCGSITKLLSLPSPPDSSPLSPRLVRP